MIQHLLTIADQRAAAPQLCWLTLEAPELARSIRPGQYLLLRCAEPGSYDPLLRRPLFIAAAEPALGQIGLLYAPHDRGLAWLARRRPGDTVDLLGPCGHGFTLDRRSRTLLLIGAGAGLPALLLLARQAAAQGCAITLLAGAGDQAELPPPFLLPGEVEYQTNVGAATDLLGAPGGRETGRQADKGAKGQRKRAGAPESPALPAALSPIVWADQICVALPSAELAGLAGMIRQLKYRWERGFAQALLDGPLVCGVGACGACAVALRNGSRMLCSEGPVFDLRDVLDSA